MPEFSAGLRCGVLAALAVCAVALWLRTRPSSRGPDHDPGVRIFGLVAILAYLEALREGGHLLPGLALGLLLLVAGGELARGRRLGWVARVGLATPGAVVLAVGAGLSIAPAWVRASVVLVILAASVLVADFDDRAAWAGLGPLLVPVTVVGVYETVPEPGLVLPLLVIVLALGLVALVVTPSALGGSGAAVAGAIVWAAAVGGRGRLGSFVGSVACLGLLIAEPLARGLARDRRGLADRSVGGRNPVMLWLITAHLAVVYVASREAGLRTRLWQAVVIAASDLGGAILGSSVAGRLIQRRQGRSARREGG